MGVADLSQFIMKMAVFNPHPRHIMRLMRVPPITLGKVLIAWLVFLLGAALILPPLDSHAPVSSTQGLVLLLCLGLLLIATPIAAVRYFRQAWQKVDSVPNRTSYVVWLGLETTAAVGVLALIVYILMHRG